MTRGRKKDLTALPSRALFQQRAYRARKEQNLMELKERCRKLEEENEILKHQLFLTRTETTPSSKMVLAAMELMQHLSNAQDAITQFQRLASQESSSFPETVSGSLTRQPNSTSFITPSVEPSTALRYTTHDESSVPPELDVWRDLSQRQSSSAEEREVSPSLESECCGGWIDCRGLVEEQSTRQSITSNVRTTSLDFGQKNSLTERPR